MPIYEYQCSKCGGLDEVLQKVSDPAPGECPACGAKETLTKVVSRTSFQLKGGGWYADLYSSTSKSGSTREGSSSDSKSATKSESSSSAAATGPSKAESTSSGAKAEPAKAGGGAGGSSAS